jgi:hypothetical protein
MMDLHIPAGAPADLFITGALDTRPPGKADYRREARAIQALAVQMGNDPAAILPQFVDLALLITGSVSGGLSLWEPSPPPGVFRWHFLRGTLSPFNGATTPRNFSPCGVTLDCNGPVLTLHPERTYTWLVEAGVAVPEVLLVPLYLGRAEPLGTLWVVSETEGHFTRDHAHLLTDLAEHVGATVREWRDECVDALAR